MNSWYQACQEDFGYGALEGSRPDVVRYVVLRRKFTGDEGSPSRDPSSQGSGLVR